MRRGRETVRQIFHCLQAQLGGYARYTAKHLVGKKEVNDRDWMYEGGAHWAACEVAPDPDASYTPDAVDEFSSAL